MPYITAIVTHFLMLNSILSQWSLKCKYNQVVAHQIPNPDFKFRGKGKKEVSKVRDHVEEVWCREKDARRGDKT